MCYNLGPVQLGRKNHHVCLRTKHTRSGAAWQSWSKSKIRRTQPAPGRQAGLFIATEGPDLTTKRNRNFVLLVLSLFPEFRWGSQTSAEIEASEKQGIRVSGDNVSCHRNLLSRQFSTAPSPSRPFFRVGKVRQWPVFVMR